MSWGGVSFRGIQKEGDGEKKQGIIGRFFHHEDKTEEEAKQEDPTHEEKKHQFLHGLFHRGD